MTSALPASMTPLPRRRLSFLPLKGGGGGNRGDSGDGTPSAASSPIAPKSALSGAMSHSSFPAGAAAASTPVGVPFKRSPPAPGATYRPAKPRTADGGGGDPRSASGRLGSSGGSGGGGGPRRPAVPPASKVSGEKSRPLAAAAPAVGAKGRSAAAGVGEAGRLTRASTGLSGGRERGAAAVSGAHSHPKPPPNKRQSPKANHAHKTHSDRTIPRAPSPHVSQPPPRASGERARSVLRQLLPPGGDKPGGGRRRTWSVSLPLGRLGAAAGGGASTHRDRGDQSDRSSGRSGSGKGGSGGVVRASRELSSVGSTDRHGKAKAALDGSIDGVANPGEAPSRGRPPPPPLVTPSGVHPLALVARLPADAAADVTVLRLDASTPPGGGTSVGATAAAAAPSPPPPVNSRRSWFGAAAAAAAAAASGAAAATAAATNASRGVKAFPAYAELRSGVVLIYRPGVTEPAVFLASGCVVTRSVDGANSVTPGRSSRRGSSAGARGGGTGGGGGGSLSSPGGASPGGAGGGDVLTLHRIRDGRTLALRLGSHTEAASWQAALTVRAGGYGVKDVGDFVVRGLASPPPPPDSPPPPAGGVALAYDVVDGPSGEALRLSVLPCAAVFAGAAPFSATLTTRLCLQVARECPSGEPAAVAAGVVAPGAAAAAIAAAAAVEEAPHRRGRRSSAAPPPSSTVAAAGRPGAAGAVGAAGAAEVAGAAAASAPGVSPFVLRLRYAMHTPSAMVLVTEATPCGDVAAFMATFPASRIPERTARLLVAEVLLGVVHLSASPLEAVDVASPSAVLLDAGGHVRLHRLQLAPVDGADGGEDGDGADAASPRWVDLRGVGEFAYHLLTGRPAYPPPPPGAAPAAAAGAAAAPKMPSFAGLSPAAASFCRACFHPRPAPLTPAAAAAMPFFAPLDWGAVAARVPQPRGEAAVSPGALLAARVAGGGGRLGGGGLPPRLAAPGRAPRRWRRQRAKAGRPNAWRPRGLEASNRTRGVGGRGREKGALVFFKEAGERVHASTARAIYVFPQRPLRGCQWMTQHWRGSM